MTGSRAADGTLASHTHPFEAKAPILLAGKISIVTAAFEHSQGARL